MTNTTICILLDILFLALLGGSVYVIASLHGTIAGLRREMERLRQANTNLDNNAVMWRCKYQALHDAVMVLKESS